MSLLCPSSKAEVARSGWLFAVLLLLPLVPFGPLWWSAHLTAGAHWWAFGTAAFLSLPTAVWSVRRVNRLVGLGIHPHYSKARPMPSRQYFAVWVGVLLSLYAWGAAAVTSWVSLPFRLTSEQSFVVVEARECKTRCLACKRRATLGSWPGAFGSVCVDWIEPAVQAGERLVVRGRFSPLGVHVESVHRANAG